jgi:hypothetical protein
VLFVVLLKNRKTRKPLKQAKEFVQAGLSESFATLYVEMACAFNDGTIKPVRTCENTTPTGFEDFADEWASAYKAM